MMLSMGRGVLMIEPDDTVQRAGEGAFIRLKNGAIMLMYSAFSSAGDFSTSWLEAVYSYDEGETWTDKRILVTPQEGAFNVMCVSLIRMQNGDIGLFHLQKYEREGIIYDSILLRTSADEGLTWSEPRVCTRRESFYVKNNDRVIRLRSGRIVIPVAEMVSLIDHRSDDHPGSVFCLYSDDDGLTWQESQRLDPPFANDNKGLEEPGFYEKDNGDLYMYIRTCLSYQYESISKDGGQTWSPIRPNYKFASPRSPMTMKKFGNKTVAILNPIANGSPFMEKEHTLFNKATRTPLIGLISENDGAHFWPYYIESDWSNDYCYASTFDGGDYVLVSYYHSNNTNQTLHSLKVTKILYEELENRYRGQ